MISNSQTSEALVAQRLREVAGRIDDPSDRELITRVAGLLDNPKLPVRLAFKNRRGRPDEWQRRFAIARFIHEHRRVHGGTLEATYKVAEAKFPMTTARTARSHWQEFGALFGMGDENRELVLWFKQMQSLGFPVRIRRTKRLPEK